MPILKFFRTIIIAAALSLFGIVAALVAIEVLFRGYRMIAPRAAQWSDRPPFYFQHEGSSTLQDYPYEPQKPANTFRIAVVGDSYTFAPFMQFTDAFPKKLEQMLNLNKSGLKAEVINYGVPAYSTQHEVSKVEQAVREGADLVLLQITLNDAELKPWTPIGITNFSRFGSFQPQGWGKKVFQVWSSLGYVVERFHNTKTHREYVRYFYEVFENPRGWREFGKAVQRINSTCQKNNRRLAVVVFPLFGVPLDGKYPFKGLHERIGSFIDSLNLPRLDLLDLYQGIPLERIQVIPGEDRHPNEIAHRMAAERIYTWLAENNYIPEELKIRLRFKGRTRIFKEDPF